MNDSTLVSIAVVAALTPPTVIRAWRLCLVLRNGRWLRKGVPLLRTEEPLRYWAWTTVEMLSVVLPIATMTYLIARFWAR